ncbi:MAG TPA: class I SAM-dependent methyltransferase [Ktedonobacterales bacterium]|nr:class I SAM-dependent methyltransferase [Ktedonobacterales bacterium]
MPSISFDRAAEGYDASRGYSPATAEAIGWALFAATGARPGSRFLEMGIGTGRIAIPLLALGANVTGVDISSRMVERLHANLEARRAEQPELPWGTLEVQLADMTALPFATNSFDAVVAVHVFHLVSDWERALDEALRVLAPGGSLLLGQDRHPGAASLEMQSRWSAIATDLGANVRPIGVSSYEAALAALQQRGLAAQESLPVTWEELSSPRDQLSYIGQRIWSRTWSVPDDLFPESIRRLEAWAELQYGAALDTPRAEAGQFFLARIVKPA